MKRESKFERDFCKQLEKHDGVMVLKNDSSMRQGIPDRIVLCGGRFAMLEFKQHAKAKHQPNQDYYIDHFKKNGGYAAFIYPENENEVLVELSNYFGKDLT